jgi:hypothetical protein
MSPPSPINKEKLLSVADVLHRSCPSGGGKTNWNYQEYLDSYNTPPSLSTPFLM